MPEITFSVDLATGETRMRIKGIRGAGCKPIHAAVSDDLKKVLGITELAAADTEEMKQAPTVTARPTVETGR